MSTSPEYSDERNLVAQEQDTEVSRLQRDTIDYENAERKIRNPFNRIMARLGSTGAQETIRQARQLQNEIDVFSVFSPEPLPDTPLIRKAAARQRKEADEFNKKYPPLDPNRGV